MNECMQLAIILFPIKIDKQALPISYEQPVEQY